MDISALRDILTTIGFFLTIGLVYGFVSTLVTELIAKVKERKTPTTIVWFARCDRELRISLVGETLCPCGVRHRFQG